MGDHDGDNEQGEGSSDAAASGSSDAVPDLRGKNFRLETFVRAPAPVDPPTALETVMPSSTARTARARRATARAARET